MALVEMKNLSVDFGAEGKAFRAVDSVDHTL